MHRVQVIATTPLLKISSTMVILSSLKLSPITDNIAIISKILSIIAIKKFVPIMPTLAATEVVDLQREVVTLQRDLLAEKDRQLTDRAKDFSC